MRYKKRFLSLSIMLSVSTLLVACNRSADVTLPTPEVVKINDHVYAMLAPREFPNPSNRGYMSNSTAVIGDKGVVLIDTGFTHEVGALLARTVATFTDKPVTHVINTHHHGDHNLGNVAFPKAQVISSEQCRQLVETTGYEWIGTVESMTGLKFPETKPVPATVVYPTNTHNRVVLEGITLDLWVPNGSHTEGDLMVYLPDHQVLVAGDILVHTITPNFNDGNVKNWNQTLGQIEKMTLQAIVPGHGPLMDVAGVAAMHHRMEALYTGVEAGYKQGLTDSEVRATLDLSEWQKLLQFEENMGGNINRTYLEVEAANF